jgi:hypothetical protein
LIEREVEPDVSVTPKGSTDHEFMPKVDIMMEAEVTKEGTIEPDHVSDIYVIGKKISLYLLTCS